MSNLAVKVSADVTDLHTKLAVAQADLRAFSAETRSLADQVRVASDAQKAELVPALQAASVGAAQAKSAIADIRKEMGGEFHGSISTATREFRALFDELSSGRTRQTPGTIAIIANRVFGLGPAALAAVGGVAALVGGLGYLAVEAYRASEAAENARAAFAFQGLSEGAAQINGWVEQVDKIPGVASNAAGKTVAAFTRIRDASPQLIEALISRLPALARGMGEDVPAAAKKLADVFADVDKKGESFLRDFHASAGTVNEFTAAAARGDRAQEFALILAQLDQAAQNVDKTLGHATATEHSFFETLGLLGAVGAPDAADAVEKLNKAFADLDASKVKQIHDAVSAGLASPTTTPKVSIPLADFEAQLEQLKEDTSRSNLSILDGEIGMYRQRLQAADIYGQARAELERRLASTIAERNREAGTEAVSAARNRISEINAQTNIGNVQKLAQERQVWQEVLNGDQLTYSQRIEAQRSFNQSTAALDRARQAEQRAISKSDADTDLAIGRLKLEEKKGLLGQEAAAKQITAQQEYDQLRDLARQEEALDEQSLQNRMALLQTEPAQREQVYNQIRVLRAKLAADLANYDKQEELDTQRATRSDVTAWRGAVNEIASAEDSMIRGIFTGRQTLNQLLLAGAARLVEGEIAADAKYLTYRLLLNQSAENSDKVTAAGGLLVHALTETRKTAATATGVATRNALGATENTSLLGKIGEMLAGWLGLETSKTASTVAGVTTRTAADVAGSTEATVGAHIAGEAYAGEAAAAAMASVAAIPITGWAMAPGVGASVFGEASGFASAARGMLSVPSDNFMIAAHAGESVLPANIAGPMRDFFSGGGQGGGDNYNVTFNVSAMDAGGVQRFFNQNGPALAKAIALQHRNANGNLRNAMGTT